MERKGSWWQEEEEGAKGGGDFFGNWWVGKVRIRVKSFVVVFYKKTIGKLKGLGPFGGYIFL